MAQVLLESHLLKPARARPGRVSSRRRRRAGDAPTRARNIDQELGTYRTSHARRAMTPPDTCFTPTNYCLVWCDEYMLRMSCSAECGDLYVFCLWEHKYMRAGTEIFWHHTNRIIKIYTYLYAALPQKYEDSRKITHSILVRQEKERSTKRLYMEDFVPFSHIPKKPTRAATMHTQVTLICS